MQESLHTPELTLRSLTPADLGFVGKLRDEAGWNQSSEFLGSLLNHQPEGGFLAEWEGSPVGVVTTTIHDARLAWIGMMLVDANFRRRGIATALLERAVRFLESRSVGCIALDATPDGREIYRRHGFHDAWNLQRWERPGPAPEPFDPSRTPDAVDLEADLEAFGVNRSAWLHRLVHLSRVSRSGRAWGFLRSGPRALMLGPVIASTPTDARHVVSNLLEGQMARVFWDIPDPNLAARELAESLGFRPVRPLIRMSRGSLPLPGSPDRQFGIADPSTG